MAFEYNVLLDIWCKRRCHHFFEECKWGYFRFLPHSDGVYPEDLIECRRPNETDEVKDYRKKVYKAKTRPKYTAILGSLMKIRRSDEWSVKYPKDDTQQFTSINEKETLEQYCEINYPEFGSLTNWVFSVLLKEYTIDANGVIMVIPLPAKDPNDPTEYKRPEAQIFNSPEVIEFEDNRYAVLADPVGCYYTVYSGKNRGTFKGTAYYEVDELEIIRWEQYNAKGDHKVIWRMEHGLPKMPVFKIKGLIKKKHGRHTFYESRLSGILEDFDEAVRDNSDLQGGKVTSLHPERWEFTTTQCVDCKGMGLRQYTKDGKPCQEKCVKCEGRGVIAAGPYQKMVIKASANTNPTPAPIPPAGYVQKDIAILELMMKTVKQDIYDGLSAINFQFLEQTPLNQSGTAKEVDKDELNNFVHSIAEDIVAIMDTIYKFTAWYRYGAQFNYDWELINKMLPSVMVPAHFDLLSMDFLQAELEKAKKSGMNPLLLNAMEVEFASKRFSNEPELADRLALTFKLDPLPNITDENKMVMLSNKGITQENYIISCNINAFVERAIEENQKFAELKVEDQRAKMAEYAQEVIEANSAQRVILGPDEGPSNGTGNQGNNGNNNPNNPDVDGNEVDTPPVEEPEPVLA